MTEAVDLTDLDMWARGVPHDEFARLRRESPVAWHDEAPPNSGFWSVCGYPDIVAASRDVATFSSARGISFEEPTDEDMAARRTIIDTDPPVVAGPLPVPGDLGAQPKESEEVRSTALGGDWEFRGIRPPRRS